MDPLALLARARDSGLTVLRDGDLLAVRGPKRLADLAAQLLDQKLPAMAALAAEDDLALVQDVFGPDAWLVSHGLPEPWPPAASPPSLGAGWPVCILSGATIPMWRSWTALQSETVPARLPTLDEVADIILRLSHRQVHPLAPRGAATTAGDGGGGGGGPRGVAAARGGGAR